MEITEEFKNNLIDFLCTNIHYDSIKKNYIYPALPKEFAIPVIKNAIALFEASLKNGIRGGMCFYLFKSIRQIIDNNPIVIYKLGYIALKYLFPKFNEDVYNKINENVKSCYYYWDTLNDEGLARRLNFLIYLLSEYEKEM